MMLIAPDMLFPAAGGGGSGAGSHRYWRFVNLSVTDATFFEVAELQLLDGVTVVSGGKTYSSQVAPDGLALSNLFDGNLSTRCWWTKTHIEDTGFYIQIDLGSSMLVDGVKQAGFDDSARYMNGFTLQSSDDGSTWLTATTKTGLSYPGNSTLSSTYSVP